MGPSLRALLLLSFSALAAATDFQPEAKASGRSFLKRAHAEQKAASIIRRSLPAWLSPPRSHATRRRRSVELGENCKALQGYDAKLAGNTHSVSYLPTCGPVTAPHAPDSGDEPGRGDAQVHPSA